jgi:hypothetical protein
VGQPACLNGIPLMKRLWKWLAIILVLVIAGLALLVFSAASWLETPSGRKLLQRELGNALGLQPVLAADYELQVFPKVQISGADLVLLVPAAAHPLAEIRRYEAHLALWPLLRKEVLVHKLALHDGSLDVDLLLAMGEGKPAGSPAPLQLPRIEAMEINGLRLNRSNAKLLEVVRLELQDFAAGEDALLSLDLRLDGNIDTSHGVALHGQLNIQAEPLLAKVQVQELAAIVSGKHWPLGEGELSWSSLQQGLEGNLRGRWGEFSGEYEFSLATSEPLQLQLGLRLESDRTGSHTADLQAHEESGNWQVDALELKLGEQQVAGKGCLEMLGGTKLHLELFAAQLDLDALQHLLPEGMAGPAGQTAPNGLSAPFPLAVELRVDEARMGGAIARDVRLLLGDEPECSSGQDSTAG